MPNRKTRPRVSHLTDAGIKRLPHPSSGHAIHWDDEVVMLGCRVTANGVKSFIFTYRVKSTGQQRSITIGRCDNWTTSAARTEAKRLRRVVDNGGDPRGDVEEEREAPTMEELIDRFEREFVPRKRPSTIRSYKGILDLHIKPHFSKFTKVADVAYADVDKLHRKVTATGSTYVANRCVAVCSKMFNLAIKWQMRDSNPCRGVERNSEGKRKRYLSGDELQRLTAALAKHDDKQFAAIIMLLVLTGARRGEVLSMRWNHINAWQEYGSLVEARQRDQTESRSRHATVGGGARGAGRD